MSLFNPFDNKDIAANYDTWYQSAGLKADRQEKALLLRMLDKFPIARTILEVGCGTGHFTRWFDAQGYLTIGIDLSRPMLNEAKRIGALPYLQADAFRLPFSSDAFDLVALITVLEFLPDPVDPLAESVRVARQGLILGVLNAHSCLGWKCKQQGGLIWGNTRFYTLDELKTLIRYVAGPQTKITWWSTLWPIYPGMVRLPWGGFLGLAATF